MSKVFIIILHYKNWDDTQDCLKSLEALNCDNFEVMVVDNGSGNNFQFPIFNFQLTKINNKKNLGFAGGMNVGIKQALKKNAEYILLLNNDIITEPNFLKELVKVGENDKQAGILGPVIYEHGSNKVHFAGGKINWLYTKGRHEKNSKLKTQNSKLVDYTTGACLLIKREVIEKIGLMDENYFLYFEDVDWCLKARRAGYKCVLVPEAKIWHKVSSSAKAESFSYIYYHFRNGLLLAKHNAPFFIKLLAYFVGFLVYIKQLIKSSSKWTKAIKTGIGDFYKGRFGNYENWH